MSTEIFRGTFNPLLQRKSIVYSPTSGYTRTWDYRGFSEQLMLNLMSRFTNAGCEVVFGGEHNVFTLQVKDSTGEITLDTWQVQQQDERPNNLENPIALSNTNAGEREIIKRALSNGISPDQAIADLTDETGDTYIPLGTYAERLYTLMNLGTTEFTRSLYILKHTTNAPSNYSANVADWGVDSIYTNSQLLTEAQNGFFWRLPLPPRLVYKIQNLVFPAVRSNYQNGWLKRGSTETTAANFRIEVNTEYWMGQWSTDLYYPW